MLKKIFKFFLVLILFIGLIPIIQAQEQTGTIKGKILDKEGYPLPGAFIYVSSPSLLGIRTYITSDTGTIRFPALPPGIYKIIVEMPGFKTANIENIIVRVGMTVNLNIALEPTTIEEEITTSIPTPPLDIESPKMATVISKELLRNIPFTKNLYDIINSASGIIAEDASNLQTSVIHGSTPRANIYTFDALTMNNPSGMHLLTDINFDIIEEVELETSSHPTGIGFTDGGYINIVTKSGQNKFLGEFNLYYTDDKAAKSLWSNEEINEREASSPSMDKKMWDFSLSLGGSILEDMLWFFGNVRLVSQTRTTPFIPWTDPDSQKHDKFDWKNDEKMGFFKLTSRFIPQLKVTGMFNYIERHQPFFAPFLTWNLPQESTRILDHERSYIVNGFLNYIIDQNTYVDLKAGYIHYKQPLILNEQGYENQQYFNDGTGHLWGSAEFNEIQLLRKFQVSAYITRFQDNFFGGNHEFRAGAEYEYALQERTTWKSDNLLIYYFYGSPYYFGQDVSPVTGNTVGKGKISFSLVNEAQGVSYPQTELRRISFFAQDSVTYGGRLTLYLGLRFDRTDTLLHSFLKEKSGNSVSLTNIGQELIESKYDVNPYVENGINQWKNIIVWNSLSPRIGLIFDLHGNGRTLLKASFSRYTEYPMLQYIFSLNPFSSNRSHQFYWYDEDGDGVVDNDDSYDFYYPEDYDFYKEENYKKSLDPDIKSPYTDEITLGLHRELFRDFIFSINYIYKSKGNILENVLYDPDLMKYWYTKEQNTENWWIPFETTVPEVDGYSNTEASAYFLSKDAPPLFYQTRNVPELKRKYRALEIIFTKRMSNNWQLNGSVVISKTTGNINLGYGASSGFSPAGESPNYFINFPEDSRLDFDRPLVVKLMGTYKFPYNFFLSFYYIYTHGTPWARSVTIIPPSSWAQSQNVYSIPAKVFLEKPGTRRTKTHDNLDLRIEKEFRLGRKGRLSTYVDIINVLGTKYDFIDYNDGGFWIPDDENTSQGTRIKSSNYLKTTYLFGTRVFRLNIRISF